MKINSQYIIKPLCFFYKAFCSTLRIAEFGRQAIDNLDKEKQLMVFSLWHDEMFCLMPIKKNLQLLALVSPSKDGEYLTRVLEQFGLECVRGSSSRKGASALLTTSKKMQAEHKHVCITVDGPRGPRHIAKQGATFLAGNTGAYIVPVRIKMYNTIKFNSWDKFQIPLPFSKVEIFFSEPYKIEQSDLEGFYASEAEKLTSILNKYA